MRILKGGKSWVDSYWDFKNLRLIVEINRKIKDGKVIFYIGLFWKETRKIFQFQWLNTSLKKGINF